jgi:hypothetical protein
VSREVSLAGIELAPLAGVHDLVGISNHGGPIKSLAERIAHEGARCRVAHTPAWMSRISSRPWGMGMHRCRTLDAARLYNSLSTMVNDLAILTMRLASDQSGESSPRSIQARYLALKYSVRGTDSISMASASSAS